MHGLSPHWKASGLLAMSLTLLGCGEEVMVEEAVARPVRAMQVADVSDLVQRAFPGRAQAAQEVNLSFRVAGPLIEFPVQVGDEVSRETLVARIDPRDFEVQLLNVEGQLERARAAQKRAGNDFQRIKRIQKQDPGATTEADVDRKEDARDQARAQVKSLEASVQAARDQLEYTHLRAPFDGTVVATYVENFESVRAKQEILRLLDTSSVEMVINVPETGVSKAQYVTHIDVTFDTFPDVVLKASIKEIGKEASQTTRTYPVTLTMPQPEGVQVLPGMAGQATAHARLPTDIVAIGIEIPASVVVEDQTGAQYVWVLDQENGVAAKRPVEVGALTNTGIRVVSGLEPGEWIATAGVHSLHDGQKVRILQ